MTWTAGINVPGSVRAAVQEHRVTLSGDVAWNFEREAAVQAVRYVTLEGHVRTFDERRQAEHLAWYAPGVTAVHNRLAVRD